MSRLDSIERALQTVLGSDMYTQAYVLARLLDDLLTNNLSLSNFQNIIYSDSGITNTLTALAGKEIKTKDALISFGEGNQFGDIKIEDIAGHSIIKATVNINITEGVNNPSVSIAEDTPCLNIPILGSRSSGKTCYVTALYNIMRQGQHGLTMRAVELNRDIWFSNIWRQLNSKTGTDRWPGTTLSNVNKIPMTLNYGHSPIFKVTFSECKLIDKHQQEDKDFTNSLAQASSVFVVISGENLAENSPASRFTRLLQKTNYSIITSNLLRIARERGATCNNPLPVVIMITKYDYCSDRQPEDTVSDIQMLFRELFSHKSGFLTMICPVSLGRSLNRDKDGSEIKPVNIEIPFKFAINSLLKQQKTSSSDYVYEFIKNMKSKHVFLEDQEVVNYF